MLTPYLASSVILASLSSGFVQGLVGDPLPVSVLAAERGEMPSRTRCSSGLIHPIPIKRDGQMSMSVNLTLVIYRDISFQRVRLWFIEVPG